MNIFENYYKSFLNLHEHKKINTCERRKEIFSFYWIIPLIITDLKNDLKASVDPSIAEDFAKSLDLDKFKNIDESLKLAVDDWFSKYSWNYQVNNYLRYTIEDSNDRIDEFAKKARPMTESDKLLALEKLNHRSEGYRNAVWNHYYLPLIEKHRIFIVEFDNIKAASAIITDIDSAGANIMVITEGNYRKQGLGKAVVAKAVKCCFENNLIPCYFHAEDNIPSQKLAESLGFSLKCKECDLFIHRNEDY